MTETETSKDWEPPTSKDWPPLKPERHAIPTDPGALLQYLHQHPKTDVRVIHRGGPTIEDKYDGQEWVIPPGRHKMPYAVARHFQRRHFLSGTRVLDNRHGLKAESLLGLPDLEPHRSQPFTAEELERAGHSVEGLNRAALDQPSARKKRVLSQDELKQALSSSRYGQGEEEGEDPEAAIEKAVAGAETAPEPIPEEKHSGLAAAQAARRQHERERGKK